MTRVYATDRDELYHLYITLNMRRREVAEHYGCSDVLIKQRLKSYGIQKPHGLECENKRRTTTLECAQCGQDYIRKEGNLSTRTRKYCSYECAQSARDMGPEHRRAKHNEIAGRRRARMRDAIVPLSQTESLRLTEIYRHCPTGSEVDHIIPISRGGKHHPDNLQYLTMKENRSKGNKI